MKIWWQSELDLDTNPAWEAYRTSLSAVLNQMARPGNQVVPRGIDYSLVQYIDKHKMADLLHTPQVIKMALRAQEQGFDAFVGGYTTDIAYSEVKEAVDIVVVNVNEIAFHLASIFGGKFGVLHGTDAGIYRAATLASRYGLLANLVPTGALNLDIKVLQQGFENPQPIIDAATPIAQEAARAGAGMLTVSHGVVNMILRTHGINEIAGVPVLEGNGAALKCAEFFLDLKALGIGTSRLAYPLIGQDAMALFKEGFNHVGLV